MSNQKQTRDKEATIKKIYEKFFNLVLEIGYHNASTNKIAQAAEISVGTLYHHFPKGKKDIIRKYFEKSVDSSVELEKFKNFSMTNPASFFKGFISNVLRDHRENKAYYIAFRSALLSNKDLAVAHKERVFKISKELVQKLQESSDFFNSRKEERLINSFTFIYNITNAVIYHHIVFMDLFESDEDIIEYLSFICAQTIDYLQKKT